MSTSGHAPRKLRHAHDGVSHRADNDAIFAEVTVYDADHDIAFDLGLPNEGE